jgi:ribosomal protein S18 acetylase RimI-like enzyme
MNVSEAIVLLRSDPLRHLVALKMLSLYGDQAELKLVRGVDGWALSTTLPIHVTAFDSKNYPSAEFFVLIDGTDPASMLELLGELPRTEVIVKTSHQPVSDHAVSHLGGRALRTFISFTAGKRVRANDIEDVTEEGKLTRDVADALVAAGGYGRSELAEAFQQGARSFAIRRQGRAISACFVYPNFETIWEIAGVFSQPEHRGQGHARRVVTAALRHLAAANLQARYQVTADNAASLRLASSLGLREFLRVTHVVVES